MAVIPFYGVLIYWGVNMFVLLGCSIQSAIVAKNYLRQKAVAFKKYSELQLMSDSAFHIPGFDIRKPRITDLFFIWFNAVMCDSFFFCFFLFFFLKIKNTKYKKHFNKVFIFGN